MYDIIHVYDVVFTSFSLFDTCSDFLTFRYQPPQSDILLNVIQFSIPFSSQKRCDIKGKLIPKKKTPLTSDTWKYEFSQTTTTFLSMTFFFSQLDNRTCARIRLASWPLQVQLLHGVQGGGRCMDITTPGNAI